MAGASMESCRFVVLRSPRGRLGWYNTCAIAYAAYAAASRVRYISHGPLRYTSIGHDLPKFWIQSSLESPKRWRRRSMGPPDLGPIPEDVREPIYRRKSTDGPSLLTASFACAFEQLQGLDSLVRRHHRCLHACQAHSEIRDSTSKGME